MHRTWIAALVLVGVMGLLAAAPVASPHATPATPVSTLSAKYYTVTVTVNGTGFQDSYSFTVASLNGNGTVVVNVNGAMLSAIQDTFGRTSFPFPGAYTGLLYYNGQLVVINGAPVTLTLQSADAFTLMFT